MKKTFIILIIAVLVLGAFTSCATRSKIIGKEGVRQPAWVTSIPSKKNYHYETGFAAMSTKQNSIRMATADARTKIAEWISLSIDSTLKSAITDSSVNGDRDFTELFESISAQVTSVTIAGITTEDTWVDENGAIWVLCCLPTKNVKESLFKQVVNDIPELPGTTLEAAFDTSVIE